MPGARCPGNLGFDSAKGAGKFGIGLVFDCLAIGVPDGTDARVTGILESFAPILKLGQRCHLEPRIEVCAAPVGCTCTEVQNDAIFHAQDSESFPRSHLRSLSR